jgi:hypothetical protein
LPIQNNEDPPKKIKAFSNKKILVRQTMPYEEPDLGTFQIYIYRIIAVSQTQIVFCILTDNEYSDADFSAKWKPAYPKVVERILEIGYLLTFLEYPEPIRSSLYSTNLIENFNKHF